MSSTLPHMNSEFAHILSDTLNQNATDLPLDKKTLKLALLNGMAYVRRLVAKSDLEYVIRLKAISLELGVLHIFRRWVESLPRDDDTLHRLNSLYTPVGSACLYDVLAFGLNSPFILTGVEGRRRRKRGGKENKETKRQKRSVDVAGGEIDGGPSATGSEPLDVTLQELADLWGINDLGCEESDDYVRGFLGVKIM